MRIGEGPVAVVGAGTMGRGIAEVVARHGHLVRLHDVHADKLVDAEAGIEALLAKAVMLGVLSGADSRETLSRIDYLQSLDEAVADCTMVIEAVPEDADIKRATIERLDQLTGPDVAIGSNTSAMSITTLASWAKHRDRVIGLHFFNPPDRMPLVEIVKGLTTSTETVSRAQRFCSVLAKETVLVNDRPGFATSRLSALIGNEAWHMYSEGVATPQEIDKAATLALGFPMGPFELGDLIGLDVRLSVLRHLHATLGERFRPSPMLVEYVSAGYLGRKTGRGIYEYHDGAATPDAIAD